MHLGSRRWWPPPWRWTLPLAAAAIALALWIHPIDWRELAGYLSRFHPRLLGAVILAGMGQVVLQGSRLHVLLPRAWGVGWFPVVKAFTAGQLANSVFPARAGDLVKVLAISRSCPGGSTTLAQTAGGVLVADKVADLGAMVALLAVSAGAERLVRLAAFAWTAPWLPGGLALLLLAGVLLPGPLRRPPTSRPGHWIRQIIDGSSGLADPRRLAAGLLLGGGVWVVETWILSEFCGALHQTVSFHQGLWAIGLLNLGTALPLTPGNVGTFEAAMTLALARAGVPTPAGLAIAGAHHAVQIGAVGGLALGLRLLPTLRRFRPKGRQDFRAALADQRRAVAFYQSNAERPRERIGSGVFRYLRRRERDAVLALAQLEDPAKSSVIDVGCGRGFYALRAKRAGKWVHAVDLAPGMIRRVRAHVDRAEVAGVEAVAPGRTYDIVLCCGVLDFVADPGVAFDNLCRLLAPGGRLVLLVPRVGWAGFVYRIEKRAIGIGVNLYRPEWLVERARRAGLTLEARVHPLPTNMALRFRAPAGEAGAPVAAVLAPERS